MTYIERVNRAIDHVLGHLGESLRLAEIARAAELSPFHFHRVFHAVVGETPAAFVKRVRLERALGMMAHAPRLSLTRIAMECGFATSSDFSRCFKQRYAMSPSAFDINGWQASRGATLQATVPAGSRLHVDRLPASHNPDGFTATIRAVPTRTGAYIRVREPYRGDAVARATHRLIAWAERRLLADGQWLGYQWDNPEMASMDDCQYFVAVEAEDCKPEGEIGRFRFPPMNVAQVEIRGGLDLELRALQWLYGTWLPRSGYVPEDQPCFEAWIGRPFAHGPTHFELYAQLPIKRA